MAVEIFSPHPAFRTFLRLEFERILKSYGLSHYSTHFKFVRYIKPYKHLPEDGGYEFEMNVDHVYMDIELFIAEKAQETFLEGFSLGLIETLRHEALHVITSPLADFAKKHLPKEFHQELTDLEENLTQRIAMFTS